jgi:dsDNA-specific endonuclease/ATPase MutS2
MSDDEEELAEDAVVEVPVEDVLDLHSFAPREVSQVVRHYLDLAWEQGFGEIRIVHGRGRGVQRQTVRTLLARDSRVERFGDAPLEAGGWGATWARFRARQASGRGSSAGERPS